MATSDPTPGEVLLDARTIAGRVAELGIEISASYGGIAEPLIMVCVLKGSLFFTADLGRAMTIPVEFDCIAVRSYGHRVVSSGSVELVKDIQTPIGGRDVLLVEDIIDTGNTTSYLFGHLARHRPRSLKLVALLNKPSRRETEVPIAFQGFEITNRFVVGYGLDHAERYRNLPDVRLLWPEPVR